jgi:hypothetical protein
MAGDEEFGPKIFYRRDEAGGGQDMDPRDVERLRGGVERISDPYFYTDASFQWILSSLKTLDNKGASPEEKAEARERLPERWQELMYVQVEEIADVLGAGQMRFRSPYPYESRLPGSVLDLLRKGTKRARRERWGRTEVARSWLDRVAIDVVWGQNMLELMYGLGTVLEDFYSGERMLEWVHKHPRTDPTESMTEAVFAKEIPGLAWSEERKQALSIPEKVNRELRKRVERGFREVAVKYQDENTFWRMAVSAVHQMDFGKDGKRKTFMHHYETGEETMTDVEVDFIQRVFEDKSDPGVARKREKRLIRKVKKEMGVKSDDEVRRLIDTHRTGDGWLRYQQQGKEHRVPKAILSWYPMPSTARRKRKYLARMEALLTLNVKDKLNDPRQGIVDASGRIRDAAKYEELIKEVEEKAETRRKSWFSMDLSLDETLAGVATSAGIVMDWSQMSATRLYWGWNYEIDVVKDERGRKKLGVVRKRAEGATTVTTDIARPGNPRDAKMSDQRKGWPAGLVPMMSEAYQKKLAEHAPDWAERGPEVTERMLRKYPPLAEAWKRLWAEDTVNGKKHVWDPEVKKRLQNMVWFLETPYYDKKYKTNIILPIFFPPEVASINFLNTISLSGGYEIKLGRYDEKADPSVWDELCSGKKMSEFDWEPMGDQALYRWMVTMGLTRRLEEIILNQETRENDREFLTFFEEPAKLYEWLKRVNLGIRDEKESTAILTMSLAPMFVVFRSADKHGIIGSAGEDDDRRREWAEEIAKWTAMFTYLPDARDDIVVQGYGTGMAKIARFYSSLIARTGLVVGTQEKRDAEYVYKDELMADFKAVGVPLETTQIETKPSVRSLK